MKVCCQLFILYCHYVAHQNVGGSADFPHLQLVFLFLDRQSKLDLMKKKKKQLKMQILRTGF